MSRIKERTCLNQHTPDAGINFFAKRYHSFCEPVDFRVNRNSGFRGNEWTVGEDSLVLDSPDKVRILEYLDMFDFTFEAWVFEILNGAVLAHIQVGEGFSGTQRLHELN